MSIKRVKSLLQETESLLSYISQDEFLNSDERSKAILINTKKNLTDRRYVVSVIAAMKAGKSTTFNALLGRDLLPNETKACTAAITEIKHANSASTYVQKIYRDGQVVQIEGNINGTLEQNFLKDVRESRARNEVASIEKYFLESPVLAIEESEYKDVVQNFILVDTPGPNEADDGKFDVTELQRIGLEKLRDSDALIMLFDYQTFKSDTNATILKNIFENREDLEKDQEKIYFLINKIDEMRERDGSVDDVISNVKQLIRQYAPVIKNPQVFAFSAKQANLARAVLSGQASDELRKEMMDKYGSKYTTKIEHQGKVFTAFPNEPEEFAEQLLLDSNILIIEENIIERMFTLSSEKMINNAIERLNQVTTNITNAVQAQIDISTQNAEGLQNTVEFSKKKIDSLRNEGEFLKEIPRKKFSELIEKINEILKKIDSNVSNAIENNMPASRVIEGTDEQSLRQQVKSMQEVMVQAVQLTLNRDVDRIQRLAIDYQTQINMQLNQAFQDLSSRANDLIDQNMSLKFQVFNMGDISGNLNLNGELNINEEGLTINDDDNYGMLASILKGAGIGLGAGIIIPGAGNIAGAVIGGIGGLLTHLFSGEQVQRTMKIYRAEMDPIKEEMLKGSKEIVKNVINDLQRELDLSRKKYINFIESQLNVFIQNLKDQLDSILTEYNKNKENIEQHLANMEAIKETMNYHSNAISTIKEDEETVKDLV